MSLAHRIPLSFPSSLLHGRIARGWLAAGALAALLTACGGGGGGGGSGPAGDGSALIRGSTPADGATGVDRNVRPELLLASPVPVGDVRLSHAGGPVDASVSGSGDALRITPALRLLPLTTYEVQAGPGATVRFTTADAAWGATAQPVENGTVHAQAGHVAMDAHGNAVAVWRTNDGVTRIVYASRYTPGAGWGTPESLGMGDIPQVAMDAAGNAIAVWGRWDAGNYGFWASRRPADGGWGAPELLNPGVTGNLDRLRIAMGAQGDAVAVWLESDAGASRYSIHANRYLPGIGWQGAQVLESVDQQAYDPVVAVDAGGNAVAVWLQTDGTRFNTMAALSGRSAGWDVPVAIETSAQSAGTPAVAASADGSFMAVWSQPGAFIETWANRFRPGSGWDGPVRIDQGGNGTYNPDVAMGAGGGAVAVWVQNTPGGGNDIWANRYVPGSGWGTPVRMEETSLPANLPRVAVDAAGNALVVWHQDEGASSTTWAARLPVGGAPRDARRIGSAIPVDSNAPFVAIDGSGGGIAIWDEYDGATRSRLVFNRFD